MKQFIKQYYLYLITALIVIISLALSFDFEKTEEQEPFSNYIPDTPVEEYIYVDIQGAVENPGVYKLPTNTRLFQLIIKAGGFSNDADVKRINQSIILQDELYIYIPNIFDQIIEDNEEEVSTKININTASKSELETLPGIGPQTAQNIIDYREDIQGFTTIEDLMDVPGIGEATFAQIAEFITV